MNTLEITEKPECKKRYTMRQNKHSFSLTEK